MLLQDVWKFKKRKIGWLISEISSMIKKRKLKLTDFLKVYLGGNSENLKRRKGGRIAAAQLFSMLQEYKFQQKRTLGKEECY